MSSKRSKVAAVISAVGVLMTVVVDLVTYIREFGGDVGECIYRLSQPEGKSALKAISELLVKSWLATKGVYRVTVDFDLPLAVMIALGKYHFLNQFITPENFPISGKGQRTVDIEIWQPEKRVANISQLQAELNKNKPGYRFIVLPELLALRADQFEFSKCPVILALGSPWDHHYGLLVYPMLFLDSLGSRDFNLGLGSIFEKDRHFGITRDEQAYANAAANVAEFPVLKFPVLGSPTEQGIPKQDSPGCLDRVA
ncbi:MAG: hypothetical protein WCT16_02660 [Candidatus Buchananbacteria bacterium]